MTLSPKKWWAALRGRTEAERSFSLGELDLKLDAHLRQRGGFFVEAGANDGVTYSNTLFFERFRDWRGLLVEPLPELAAKCRQYRPRCLVENCALVGPGYEKAEVELNACSMMSFVPGAMGSPEGDAEHLRKGSAVQGIEPSVIRVPALTFNAVLEKHGISRIDLLSLDVEGFELPALSGLDLERFGPCWILVEVRDRAAVDRFLEARYEPVAELSHHDVLYRRRE
jgi:FkbM family methyltransferase